MTGATRGQRYDVRSYYALATAGVLAPEDRVELIEGEVVPMAPIRPAHSGCVMSLDRALHIRLGSRSLVWTQNPLRLDDWSEPVPDIVLLPLDLETFRHRHPSPGDALLVIEVADTTVRHDRGRKLPLYARFGVAEVWIVVLRRSIVEVYREPGAGGYGSKTILGRGASLSPLAFPDVTFTVDEILG